MHVAQQEEARREAAEQSDQLAAVEAGAGRGALEAVEQTLAVALGLQAAEEPGADVAEALVVEVHRVLGREHDPEPEGARLLEQRQ